jgi:tetratricopeptide (TPR) repeat protein
MPTAVHKKSVKVFVSYSQKDKPYLERLRSSLSTLTQENIIQAWYDGQIVPGQEWEKQIYENLNGSDIILLLVSPDFVNSQYAYKKEMERAIERHDQHEARVIPVIVRPIYGWQDTPFGKLQALPSKGEPVGSSAWPSEDYAWYDVAEGIATAVNSLLSERESKSTVKVSEPSGGHTKETASRSLPDQRGPQFESEGELRNENGQADSGQHADTIQSLNQTIIDAQKQKGNYLAMEGYCEEAIGAYEEALRLRPDYPEAWFNKGVVLSSVGRFEDALWAFEEALRLRSDYPLAWYSKGLILLITWKDRDEARAAFNEAFKRDALF